ncbi:MAG: ParB/RepB/Spo0J family partition protein [Oscillospiraceae bacterium]|jgi:ParB family chromosome partitioning protein|nr:ParB/RepB/Spo0J family partition protein [Oscillospiraceae bacterium]
MAKRSQRAGMVLLLAAEEIFPNPNQPRRQFDPKELESLAASIRENGILQPLTVRKRAQGGYELIAGERRLRAAKLAGVRELPCLLAEVSEERSALLALVENIQRQDLGFFEEAEAVQRLMEAFHIPQEQMAKTLGKATSTVSNKLRLLKLPVAMRERIVQAGLTERHARALLRVDTEEQRQQILETVIARGLNVQETDKLIEAQTQTQPKPRATIRLVRDVRLFVNSIHHAVDTMRRSGIAAISETTENNDYLIYTVRIPKEAAGVARRAS